MIPSLRCAAPRAPASQQVREYQKLEAMAFQWRRVRSVLRQQPWLPRNKRPPTYRSLLGTIIICVALAAIATLTAFKIVDFLLSDNSPATPASTTHATTSPEAADTTGQRSKTSNIELFRTSLTIVGGIGAVTYLVIKYRERASLERGEADAKLAAAVTQLGSESPQVRIAGVYALANVADTYGGDYNQRVVDILCGYLRTDRLLKDKDGNTRYALDENGIPNPHKPLSADGPVESTILKVLADHLKSSDPQDDREPASTTPTPWSHCTLDFYNAKLTETLHFDSVQLWTINLAGTEFYGPVDFSKSTIENALQAEDMRAFNHFSFAQGTFLDDAYFLQAMFDDVADFHGADFRKAARFRNTEMRASFFYDTTFGLADFNQSRFKSTTVFSGCSSSKRIIFTQATFLREVEMMDIEAPSIIFEQAQFNIDYRKLLNFAGITLPPNQTVPRGARLEELDARED